MTSERPSPVIAPPTASDAAWRAYFRNAALRPARFTSGADFLRDDISHCLKRLVPPDARVLEAGVGGGETLAALPNAVRHGIDYVPEALEAARARCTGVELTLGDALTYQTDARYDAIVCDRILHSSEDIQQMLTNLSTLLAPGGRIVLTCFNYLWEAAVSLGETLGFKHESPPGNWLSETDMENLFELSGLEVVKLEDRMLSPLPLPGARLLNRYISKLPVVRRAAFYRVYVLRRAHEKRMEKLPKVTVVVPARNEAGNVPNIVARTPMMGSGTELIFVEGGSSDDTRGAIDREIAAYKGPLALSVYQQSGKGKNDAVRLGFANATGDLLMILDADMTVPPEDLPKFYDAMVGGLTDYVHGTRLVYPMESQAMRFLNKLGNIGFSKVFSFLLNQQIKDTLCGTKVLWTRDWLRLEARRHELGDFDPFGDFDIIFGASRLNLRILEIPIRYRDRTYGSTNIDRFRHGWMLLKMSFVAATELKFV